MSKQNCLTFLCNLFLITANYLIHGNFIQKIQLGLGMLLVHVVPELVPIAGLEAALFAFQMVRFCVDCIDVPHQCWLLATPM